jgi:hypothetical protein
VVRRGWPQPPGAGDLHRGETNTDSKGFLRARGGSARTGDGFRPLVDPALVIKNAESFPGNGGFPLTVGGRVEWIATRCLPPASKHEQPSIAPVTE